MLVSNPVLAQFYLKNTKMKVELLEIFGNDDMVANAARVSFGPGPGIVKGARDLGWWPSDSARVRHAA